MLPISFLEVLLQVYKAEELRYVKDTGLKPRIHSNELTM